MQANDPTLTIFIPAYNAEAYLAETIESLLSQSFHDFELIVADDGSSDRTVAVAETYVSRDPRVRLVRSSHHGEVAARNKALSVAHPASKYFLNHDSDDISLPGKLAAQVQYLETHPQVSIVGTRAEYFDDAGRHLGSPPIETAPAAIRASFHETNSMIHSASMIRREVLETIGGYRREFQSVDDYDFFMRALLAGFSLANIPEVLHRIRLHARSIGNTRAAVQQQLAEQVQSIYRTHRDSPNNTILRSPLTLSRFYRVRTAPPQQQTPSQPLRILFTVQMYHPQIGGSEEVVKQLSERLVKRGHNVTVATGFHPARNFSSWNGVEIRQFRIQGNAVHGIHGESDAYQRFLLEGHFDVVVNYAAQIWSSDLVFPLLEKLKASLVFIPCGYSALADPAYRNYFAQLPGILAKYDRVVHLSPNYRDARFSQQHGLGNSLVIGNAASEEEFRGPSESFRKTHGIETPNLIVTVANHYHGKGHNHILKWFSELQRDDVTLAVIGDRVQGGCWEECNRTSQTLPRVRFFEGLTRPEVVNAFKDADLFWFGSEVECFPLVILEAMAAGTPWLSTDVGNVAELGGGWIGAPDQMVRKADTLLNSPMLRAELARIGRTEWENKYTWNRIVNEYEGLFNSVVPASESRSAKPVSPTTTGPLVSVVIPCFNQAQYLPDAVQSIVAQTYRDIEVIIVDDGSSDSTRLVAQALIEKNPAQAIRLVSHSNRGLAESRNEGIRAARGAYILPLDADDKIKPTFLDACVEKLKTMPSASIVAVNLEEFGESQRRLSCGNPVLEFIAVENQINYCSLFPKSLWETVGGYRSNMRWGYEDWDFWISCLEQGASVAVVPDHLFLYRKRGASMYSEALEHASELQAQIVVNHPKLYDSRTETWAQALLLIKREGSDMDAHAVLADYYISRARWSEALPHLTALAEKPRHSPDLELLRGAARLKLKQFDEGKATLRRYLDESPGNATAHFLMAVAEACTGNTISALAHAEDAIELDMKLAEAFELVIAICRSEQDFESATDLVGRASELQVTLSPWILSDLILAAQNGDAWADVLFPKYLHSTPLPLLQLAAREPQPKPAKSNQVAGMQRSGLSIPNRKATASPQLPAQAPAQLKDGELAVSVIIPTHNRPGMLTNAIQSVLNQTYQNFEILVINDAGTDVGAVVEKMNASGKITYIRHDRNRGLAAARNSGVKLARGKYIAYLDDDDLFYPDHLQVLVHCLENNDCGVAYTDANRAHQAQQGGRTVVTHKDQPFSCDFDHDRILVGNFIPVLCVMHRKACLEQSGLFDESLTSHEDWDLWIRLSRQYRFGHVRKVTCEFSWRTNGTSMTSQILPDFLRTLEIIYDKYKQYSAAKPQVLEAQQQYRQDKKDALRSWKARPEETGGVDPEFAPILARVERYLRMGKKDIAAKIIQKELGRLKDGAGNSFQQEQLAALYQAAGLKSARGAER